MNEMKFKTICYYILSIIVTQVLSLYSQKQIRKYFMFIAVFILFYPSHFISYLFLRFSCLESSGIYSRHNYTRTLILYLIW